MSGKVIILIVLIIILVAVSVTAFGKSKNNANPNVDPGLQPGPVRCDPGRPGYTMTGEFSIQCAGGTPPCQSGKPGYDVNGNLQAYCGVPCDPNNLAYDVNGNFNILCGGGVWKTQGNSVSNQRVDISKSKWGFNSILKVPGSGKYEFTGTTPVPFKNIIKAGQVVNISWGNYGKMSNVQSTNPNKITLDYYGPMGSGLGYLSL